MDSDEDLRNYKAFGMGPRQALLHDSPTERDEDVGSQTLLCGRWRSKKKNKRAKVHTGVSTFAKPFTLSVV